eukprot:6193950-Prymnesium_polylepis.1
MPDPSSSTRLVVPLTFRFSRSTFRLPKPLAWRWSCHDFPGFCLARSEFGGICFRVRTWNFSEKPDEI